MNSNSEIFEVRKETVFQEYKGAREDGRALLGRLFGKMHFLSKITDRISSFEDACAEVGEDPLDRKFHEGEPDEVAYRKLKAITRAYNEGWKPNWNNGNERKWLAWWYLDAPGFRLNGIGYRWTLTTTSVGSRLCFSSEENARDAASKFKSIYQTFITTDND